MSEQSIAAALGELLGDRDWAYVQMAKVRDACGLPKLGNRIVKDVSEDLHNAGFGHLPLDLPTRATMQVWIYQKSSGLGRILTDALNPTPNGMRRLSDLGSKGAEDKLSMIRAILKDDD